MTFRSEHFVPAYGVDKQRTRRTGAVSDWFPDMLKEMPGPLDTPCMVWTGLANEGGYGKLSVQYRTRLAHRVAWEIEHGEIPEDKQVNHRCDVPLCCNVAHLYLGDQTDNMNDAARRTAAARGEGRYNAKLTEAIVREARSRNAAGESVRAIARSLNAPYDALYLAVRGKTWRHVQ